MPFDENKQIDHDKLADDELDNVSGGSCGEESYVKCPECGKERARKSSSKKSDDTLWDCECGYSGHPGTWK